MKHLPLLFLFGCSGLGGLGGQEGEPIETPPAAEGDADGMAGGCEVVASCEGYGWCASYSAIGLPDGFDAACQEAGGVPSDQPCTWEASVGICSGGDVDGCGGVYLYPQLTVEPEAFCEALDAEFFAVR
ncbi:MAG: hypothetical protein KC656_15110 [Myxococcales bacterium]|nr:hypothetical protein [Myxococcales bacterium]